MKPEVIYLASDHAGFPIKEKCQQKLAALGFQTEDLGPVNQDRVDYPDFADKVCQNVKNNSKSLGLLICGSGQGMAMRANKYSDIRAALCWNKESTALSRQHNNANILCVGARLLEEANILELLEVFINTEFEGGRHQNRVAKISSPT